MSTLNTIFNNVLHKLDALTEWCKVHIGVDGFIHLIISAIIVKAFALAINMEVGIFVAVTLGIMKEFYDAKRGGKFDYKDLKCDGLGILFAILMSW